ncbi:hypothetical protein HJFPF1_02770 [Paramyrothecium foliicola]|nr:hypothetical protein HJFPF1_02770 [Paramyrothecium foliicola]
MLHKEMAQPDLAYRASATSGMPWIPTRSSYPDTYASGTFRTGVTPTPSMNYSTSNYNLPAAAAVGHAPIAVPRPKSVYTTTPAPGPGYPSRPHSGTYGLPAPAYNSFQGSQPQVWDQREGYSPTDSVDDIIASPNLSEYSLEGGANTGHSGSKSKQNGKPRTQRRPSNRDEFDGPHQFLQRPPPEIIALQERELPHLPTNLHVQEQDSILNSVNDRLSQCAFHFVAKYQFPIPLTQDMRPVERPQDREWTEWVYLLKRLATKRRIPARVLYNGQIKQFVTILENSLEMRHAAKHQSRPLKDDRNILQLISAGIQVAKILKDASAMDYLDRLYVTTEQQIQERANARFRS